MVIREMTASDNDTVIGMMRDFYASPAVLSNGSEEIFISDITSCVGNSPYLDGYIISEDGQTVGYAMIAKSFSTEFGKPCAWVEDLYILPCYRSRGFGAELLRFAANRYPKHILRLEAEAENEGAICLYKKAGFEVIPYIELKKDSLE